MAGHNRKGLTMIDKHIPPEALEAARQMPREVIEAWANLPGVDEGMSAVQTSDDPGRALIGMPQDVRLGVLARVSKWA